MVVLHPHPAAGHPALAGQPVSGPAARPVATRHAWRGIRRRAGAHPARPCDAADLGGVHLPVFQHLQVQAAVLHPADLSCAGAADRRLPGQGAARRVALAVRLVRAAEPGRGVRLHPVASRGQRGDSRRALSAIRLVAGSDRRARPDRRLARLAPGIAGPAHGSGSDREHRHADRLQRGNPAVPDSRTHGVDQGRGGRNPALDPPGSALLRGRDL
ncbi:hypothetical protein GALL_451290 [mine drainage metagenome]|uniref:Uncharacterized protein n=1 Tax=mine drainage metagenome TaxID=410659 RepID=A0A1J5PP08_9ZZZZ